MAATSGRNRTKRLRFTDRAIAKIQAPESGRIHIYDTREEGFGLRVEANGRKSFFWFRTVAGVPTFKALGTFPAVTAEAALKKAREKTVDLDNWKDDDYEGPNPFERAEDGELTFGDMLNAYIEKHTMQYAARPDEAAKRVRWMVEKYLPGWRARKVKAIKPADVRKLHREVGQKSGHVIADRVVQLIRRAFFWAIDQEKILSGANPASKAVKFWKHNDRERFLQRSELARLFEVLAAEPNVDLRDAVLLALFTGARKRDVLSMKWADVFLDDNAWRVPEPKGGKKKAYSVPLVSEAIGILRARKARAIDDAVFVFPGTGTTGHYIEPKRSWTNLRKRAGIQDVTYHDLRRTLGAWLAAGNASPIVIGKALGHRAGSSATAIYARLNLDPVRDKVAVAVGAMLSSKAKKPKARAMLPARSE